jgi:hypothetical protein
LAVQKAAPQGALHRPAEPNHTNGKGKSRLEWLINGRQDRYQGRGYGAIVASTAPRAALDRSGCRWRRAVVEAARRPSLRRDAAVSHWARRGHALARAYVGGRQIESHGPLARFCGAFGRFRAGFAGCLALLPKTIGHVRSTAPSAFASRASRCFAFLISRFSSGVSLGFGGDGNRCAIALRRTRSSLHFFRWRSVSFDSVIFRFPWESGCRAIRLIRSAGRLRNCWDWACG